MVVFLDVWLHVVVFGHDVELIVTQSRAARPEFSNTMLLSYWYQWTCVYKWLIECCVV